MTAVCTVLIGGVVATTANAQSSCTISGGSVTAGAGVSCAVPPGTVLTPTSTAITASGGQVIANSITINPALGGGSTGLSASAATGQITAGNLTLTMNGFGSATAAKATTGSTITLNGGTTVTFNAGGGGNTGLFGSGIGSQLGATGVTLTMRGGGGNDLGVEAAAGATTGFNGGSITVQGNGGGETGLLATGAGSTLTATATPISVSGSGGDIGAEAAAGATTTITVGSVSVQTNSGGETGLYATGAGSALSAAGTAISVSGSGSRGGFLQSGGTMTLTGGSVVTSGSGTYGFLLQAPAGVTNTLTASGTPITSAADVFAVQGGTANIALSNGVTASSTNGILLSAAQGGGAPAVVTFGADASTLIGTIVTDSASTNNVKLTNGTVWTMTGNSNMTTLVNNQSQIVFASPTGDPTQSSSYKTLTAGSYVGTNAQMVLNTYLGNDSSPSDKLVINGGTAPDATTLIIHNTTGQGAATSANGIQVVQAINGGTTAAGAFALPPGELRVNVFQYRLFRGGLGGTNPDDWFLRSTFLSPVTPPEEIQVLPPGVIEIVPPGGGPVTTLPPPPGLQSDPPTLPTDPPPAALPVGLYPIIGPELAIYSVAQPIARQMGQAMLGTLHERIGEALSPASDRDPGDPSHAAWARVIGQQIDNHYLTYADSRVSGRLIGVQAGLDLWQGSLIAGHRDAVGVYFAYGNSHVEIDGLVTNADATGYTLTRTGTLDLDAYSGGAYWVHYGPAGWYLDAVFQGTHYEGNTTTQFTALPIRGLGLLPSLEAGYPVRLPLGPGFVLEPQAQIMWQRVELNTANDGIGEINLTATSGATGRLGLRGQWSIANDNGMLWQPYLRTNLWRDWGGRGGTIFGIDQVPLAEQATRLEFAGGLTAKLREQLSLYTQIGYQFAIGGTQGGQRDSVHGDIGLRYSW